MSTAQIAALLAKLRQQPELLRDLEPRVFEEVISELLRSSGFDVEISSTTHDGGRDIVAVGGDPAVRLLVQCKHYSDKNKVGIADVQAIRGATEMEKATKGMLVTTSSFSKPAIEFAKENEWRLDLVDYDGLRDWLARSQTGNPQADEPTGVNPTPLELFIDPGTASAEDLSELYFELSKLYRMMGGPGIDFRVVDAREPAFVEESL